MFELLPWAEEAPRIRMKMLKDLGVFTHPNHRFGLSIGNISIIVVYNDSDDNISIVFDDGELKIQKVSIEWVSLKYGKRPYFYSELSGDVSLDIYLYKGFWDSRFGHGLPRVATKGRRPDRWRAKLNTLEDKMLGAEGYGRPRGTRRQRIAADLLRTAGGTVRLDFEVAAEVESARNHARKLKRRAYRYDARKGPLSTLAGAKAGMSAAPRPEDPWVLGADMRREARTTEPLKQLPRFKGPVAFVEDHAVLDGVSLASLEPPPVSKLPPRLLLGGKMKLPRTVHAWALNFQWPPEVLGDCRIVQVAVERRSDLAGVVQVRVQHARHRMDYEIELQFAHHGGRTRWYFICPVSGKRCDRLFFRGGRFASAAGQRLVHKSQRVAKHGAESPVRS